MVNITSVACTADGDLFMTEYAVIQSGRGFHSIPLLMKPGIYVFT